MRVRVQPAANTYDTRRAAATAVVRATPLTVVLSLPGNQIVGTRAIQGDGIRPSMTRLLLLFLACTTS
jgi:hypothetical protein